MKRALFAFVLAGGLAAHAQDVDVSEPTISRGQGWSYLSGKTVGQNNTVVSGDIGWPGLQGQVLRGVNRQVDIGGRFTFSYGTDGQVNSSVVPGIAIQGVIRIGLYDANKLNLGLTFAPGPFFWFYSGQQIRVPGGFITYGGQTIVGLSLPVSFTLGIPVGSALMINIGLDVPFHVLFGNSGRAIFPVLIGGGVEYFIDSKLAVSMNLRMGPTIDAGYAYFTLLATIGVAYKI